jgi:predicted glycoside hydrolase/deacetylase ChbG (UPF0249 family)
MKKRIVLCADDYGQAPSISYGILDLIQAGRLTATSCIVNMPHWEHHAKWLMPFAESIDIGLHFNLTEGEPLSSEYRERYGANFMPLPRLLRKAWMQQLNQSILLAECLAQIDYFKATIGSLPNHLDGHQHVHQFPMIRDAMVEAYQLRMRREKRKQAYIRALDPRIRFLNLVKDPKKIIILASGTRGLRRLLIKHRIPFNASFSGIYSFNEAKHYSRYFMRFLREVTDGGLIMCHPGRALREVTDDPIAHSRGLEYQYFMSEQFMRDCVDSGVELCRFI